MGASASTPGGLGAPQADLDGADGPFQHVPGLRNEGNTCFANAVLQAVAALPQFHAHLERIVRSGSQPGMAKAMDPLCQLVAGAGAGSLQDARDAMFEAGGSASQQTRAEADDVDQRTQLAGRLLGLVQRLSRASVAPVAPEDSRVVVGDFNAMFRRHGESGLRGDQQDAHEMLLLLESALARDADDEEDEDAAALVQRAQGAPAGGPLRRVANLEKLQSTPSGSVLVAPAEGAAAARRTGELVSSPQAPAASPGEAAGPTGQLLAIVPLRTSPLVNRKRSRVRAGSPVASPALDEAGQSHSPPDERARAGQTASGDEEGDPAEQQASRPSAGRGAGSAAATRQPLAPEARSRRPAKPPSGRALRDGPNTARGGIDGSPGGDLGPAGSPLGRSSSEGGAAGAGSSQALPCRAASVSGGSRASSTGSEASVSGSPRSPSAQSGAGSVTVGAVDAPPGSVSAWPMGRSSDSALAIKATPAAPAPASALAAEPSSSAVATAATSTIRRISPLRRAMLFAAADAASITSVMHHARQSLAADPSGRALQELVQSAIRTARLSSGLPVTPLLVSPAQLVSLARPRRTKLRSPFRGATATCIKCLGCNTFSDWSLQPFTCLSLPIHGSDVRTCLSRQLHDERISEDYRCDRCHGVHPAVKRSRLVRLPSVLVIHLQRQTVGAYGPVKISAAVRFGVSLDVSALCARARSPRDAAAAEGTSADEAAAIAAAAAGAATSKRPSGKAVYSLMSVVTHLGGPFGGHYVAFRRVPQPASTRAGPEPEAVRKPAKGLWAYVSDEVTKSVPLAEVKKAEAYMLMYARSDPDADPACGAEGVSREPGLGYWDVSGGGHRLAYSYA